ncbi:hypothetical protein OHC33_011053 [Knufia fluminis]|uniref:Uncharacterized protein n=1 Tax=Knufia fluminis TaxID=191047 RepID=A0AAN8EIJ3_9EURO|nr:hypothetical protein OHC33_011053 [Knufia fluminis]
MAGMVQTMNRANGQIQQPLFPGGQEIQNGTYRLLYTPAGSPQILMVSAAKTGIGPSDTVNVDGAACFRHLLSVEKMCGSSDHSSIVHFKTPAADSVGGFVLRYTQHAQPFHFLVWLLAANAIEPLTQVNERITELSYLDKCAFAMRMTGQSPQHAASGAIPSQLTSSNDAGHVQNLANTYREAVAASGLGLTLSSFLLDIKPTRNATARAEYAHFARACFAGTNATRKLLTAGYAAVLMQLLSNKSVAGLELGRVLLKSRGAFIMYCSHASSTKRNVPDMFSAALDVQDQPPNSFDETMWRGTNLVGDALAMASHILVPKYQKTLAAALVKSEHGDGDQEERTTTIGPA